VQYNGPPRTPVIAIYTTQYWQWQYRVEANLRVGERKGFAAEAARGSQQRLGGRHRTRVGSAVQVVQLKQKQNKTKENETTGGGA